MRILYPYNEILPKKSAHDVYIVRNCAGLAAAGVDVTIAIGLGSLNDNALTNHYQISSNPNLHLRRLPIVRRNFGLPINMNAVFFWAAQQTIKRMKPDWVALSVLKQGAFHLRRKVPGVKYVYEVHELAWYPGQDHSEERIKKQLIVEREMLSKADAITVTTSALKQILLSPPYSITTPIAVIPLAVDFTPLPETLSPTEDLEVVYVGQMYEGQGVELLLQALAHCKGIKLTLIGGKPSELEKMSKLSEALGIATQLNIMGYIPPVKLTDAIDHSHVFVAPFTKKGRMPYVSHTKLFEYAAWQRPIIAPDLPVTREHFSSDGGWIPFTADDINSLAEALQCLTDRDCLQFHSHACKSHKTFSWQERSLSYLDFLATLCS